MSTSLVGTKLGNSFQSWVCLGKGEGFPLGSGKSGGGRKEGHSAPYFVCWKQKDAL